MSPELAQRLAAWKSRGVNLELERRRHREELAALVETAKGQGVPAAQVARELGMTRQALRYRIGKA